MAMSEPGHFVRNPGRQGDDGHAHQTDTRSPPVDGSEVVYVDNPFLDEVCRNISDGQSEQVFDLCGENRDGDTARKAHYDGIRDVFDDGTQMEYS